MPVFWILHLALKALVAMAVAELVGLPVGDRGSPLPVLWGRPSSSSTGVNLSGKSPLVPPIFIIAGWRGKCNVLKAQPKIAGGFIPRRTSTDQILFPS